MQFLKLDPTVCQPDDSKAVCPLVASPRLYKNMEGSRCCDGAIVCFLEESDGAITFDR